MKLKSIVYNYDVEPHGSFEVSLANIGDPDMEPTVTMTRYMGDGEIATLELNGGELYAAANIATEHGMLGQTAKLPITAEKQRRMAEQLHRIMGKAPPPITKLRKVDDVVEAPPGNADAVPEVVS